MNVLIAPDKFKGTLTAPQVCEAVASAILSVHPHWSIEKIPMADGGEGTCEILTSLSGGKKVMANSRDPLFRDIKTFYGLAPDGQTAFIEMANASGLQLLNKEEQNPMLTSSIGTGDLIVDASRKGVTKIIVGCGGSATNDGGIGMASALGFSFLDEQGNILSPIGKNLSKIKSIERKAVMREISACDFLLIVDVDNPLCGQEGASQIFAPQKGATPYDVPLLDSGLAHFANIVEAMFGKGITDFPGAGAAGGFPVAARAFLNATMKPGIDFIMQFANMAEKIGKADLVITGEGKFDRQSLRGKTVSGMAHLCKTYQKKLVVVCGVSEITEKEAKDFGIEKILIAHSNNAHAGQKVFKVVKEFFGGNDL